MMSNSAPLGVLLMAYGTPRSLDEVETYYTHIRHGHAPTPEQLADLVRRYEAIGGVSPLNDITVAEAHKLEVALNRDGGRPCKVYLGMKHTYPFIADAVRQMAADGITEAVTLVLAPHYSSMSVGQYQQNADAAAAETGGPRLLHVDSWHLHPKFLHLIADRVRVARTGFPHPRDMMVIFSAHSLPARIIAQGDPYQQQLHETGDAVAAALDIPHHQFAWQSAGRTNDAWLGPDILDVIRDLAAQGWRQVLLCPVGFVSDHLEVLYDVDIEAQELARELGIRLVRTYSLNADPAFIETLRDVVRQREVVGFASQHAAHAGETGENRDA